MKIEIVRDALAKLQEARKEVLDLQMQCGDCGKIKGKQEGMVTVYGFAIGYTIGCLERFLSDV